ERDGHGDPPAVRRDPLARRNRRNAEATLRREGNRAGRDGLSRRARGEGPRDVRISPALDSPPMIPKPLWLLAELTYRCPLQCPYCSNPLDFAGPRFKRELSTEEWCRVFREAKALGVLQLGLSGGEPTLRADLAQLVGTAHGLGLYTSLITSAYRLTKERLADLKAAGLDHVQISIQGADAELSDAVAGTTSYRDKIAAYHYTRELGFPLTVNVVLHRRNLHQVEALIRLAESLGAERIELANTQFYGWALHNRDVLMPTRAQLDE